MEPTWEESAGHPRSLGLRDLGYLALVQRTVRPVSRTAVAVPEVSKHRNLLCPTLPALFGKSSLLAGRRFPCLFELADLDGALGKLSGDS